MFDVFEFQIFSRFGISLNGRREVDAAEFVDKLC